MPSKLSFVSLNIGALLMLSAVITIGQQTALAQNPNANPNHSMENYWEFIYYVDNDNNPNTPPQAWASGPFISNQECQDKRNEIIERGTQSSGGQEYPVVQVSKCEMTKTTVYDTDKFCYTYSIEPKDPESGSPDTFNECRNTRQLCENERQGNIAYFSRSESDYTITEISKCQNARAT